MLAADLATNLAPMLAFEPRFAVDLLVILAAAGLVATALARFRLPPIPIYLVSGALVGPSGLALLSGPQGVSAIADLAIVLLMFTIGLHLDLRGHSRGMVPVLLIGAISTVATAVLGMPLAMAFGLSAPQALAVSMAIAMSSTAVVLRILQQRREMGHAHGRLAFGVLIMQDLLVLVALALLPVLAAWSGRAPDSATAQAVEQALVGSADGIAAEPHAQSLLVKAAVAIVVMAAFVTFGRYVLNWLLSQAARLGSSEVVLVVSAASALGAAVAAASLGFSPELGAFLAGFLLASTPFKYEISGHLAPLRDIFMAIFFTITGSHVDLGLLLPTWWVILLAVPAIVLVKTLSIGLTSWSLGATPGTAAQTALTLAQAGEFSLVVLAVAAKSHGLLAPEEYGVLIIVVVGSLIITPWLTSWGRWVGGHPPLHRAAPWIRRAVFGTLAGADESGEKPRRVIIAGFGVVGRAIADRLNRLGFECIIVELNPATVKTQRNLGRSVMYGDIANPDLLESIRVHDADAVLLTIPDDEAMLRACRAIRAIAPSVYIAARASYMSRAFLAKQFGADSVVVSEVVTTEAMVGEVLRCIEARRAAASQPTDDAKPDSEPDPEPDPEPDSEPAERPT